MVSADAGQENRGGGIDFYRRKWRDGSVAVLRSRRHRFAVYDGDSGLLAGDFTECG